MKEKVEIIYAIWKKDHNLTAELNTELYKYDVKHTKNSPNYKYNYD